MPEGGAKGGRDREGRPSVGQSCSRQGCSALTKGEGDDGGGVVPRGPPGTLRLRPHLKWYLPSPSLRMMASLSASLMRLRSSTTSSSSEGKN